MLIAMMRLVKRFTRSGYEEKVKISVSMAKPSWVTVEDGGPLPRKVQMGCSNPFKVVPK